MTNKEITTVKERINTFAKNHPMVCTALVCGGATIVYVGSVYLISRYKSKLIGIDEVAKTKILENSADEYCAIKDDFMIDLDPKSIADTIGKIKNEGFAITKEGLDALQAVIDNPVIID